MDIYKFLLIIAFFSLSPLGHSVSVHASSAQTVNATVIPESGALKLEREKFEYQKILEDKKLEVEQLKAWLNGGSIVIPLLLGAITLAWQSRTAAKLKEREARDAFELKAAEIVFTGDSARATKNKARALTVLFPKRLPSNFGDAFEPEKFSGPRWEAQLEVFKAACSKVQSSEEVYKIWYQLFPGDIWIKSLLSTPPPLSTDTPTSGLLPVSKTPS